MRRDQTRPSVVKLTHEWMLRAVNAFSSCGILNSLYCPSVSSLCQAVSRDLRCRIQPKFQGAESDETNRPILAVEKRICLVSSKLTHLN